MRKYNTFEPYLERAFVLPSSEKKDDAPVFKRHVQTRKQTTECDFKATHKTLDGVSQKSKKEAKKRGCTDGASSLISKLRRCACGAAKRSLLRQRRRASGTMMPMTMHL